MRTLSVEGLKLPVDSAATLLIYLYLTLKNFMNVRAVPLSNWFFIDFSGFVAQALAT